MKNNSKVFNRSWQRLALSSLGIAIIAGMWRWAVFHLYALPEHSLVAFSSLTNNAFYTISAIVIFMVTGKLVYDWKNSTASTVAESMAVTVAEEFQTPELKARYGDK